MRSATEGIFWLSALLTAPSDWQLEVQPTAPPPWICQAPAATTTGEAEPLALVGERFESISFLDCIAPPIWTEAMGLAREPAFDLRARGEIPPSASASWGAQHRAALLDGFLPVPRLRVETNDDFVETAGATVEVGSRTGLEIDVFGAAFRDRIAGDVRQALQPGAADPPEAEFVSPALTTLLGAVGATVVVGCMALTGGGVDRIQLWWIALSVRLRRWLERLRPTLAPHWRVVLPPEPDELDRPEPGLVWRDEFVCLPPKARGNPRPEFANDEASTSHSRPKRAPSVGDGSLSDRAPVADAQGSP